MPGLSIARRPKRRGLLVSRGLQNSPFLLFPMDGADKEELENLIRAILAKGGVTEESEVQAVIEKAEQDSEIRIHVAEAQREVRRLLALRWQGHSLIQMGYRKWKECYYPAVKRFTKDAKTG